MKDYKIFQILKSLSGEEFTEFMNFSDSKYYNPKRDYSKLLKEFKYIKSGLIDQKSLTPETFYGKISKSGKHNKQTLRNRFNELTRLAERFLIEKELKSDEELKTFLLLRAYKNKKLHKQFNSEFKIFEEMFSGKTEKSFNISEILKLKVYFLKDSGNFPEMFSTFYRQIDYLISYFLEILFDAAIEFEIERTYKISPSSNIVLDFISNLNADKLVKQLEEKKAPAYLYFILKYYVYKSFSEKNDPSWYKILSSLFYGNLGKINNEQIDIISGYMISFLIFKINSGETGFLKDVFKLYKLKLKYKLTNEMKELRYPSGAFRDYVVVGIRLKQYAWVEYFIDNYFMELPEEIRDVEKNTAYARLYFVKKEFGKAIEYLNDLRTNNYIYILDASRFKLRIYYETLDFEKAFLEIDNTKHYIKNNTKKISLMVRKYSLEFLDFYNKLLKYRLNPQVKDLEYFSNEVKESKSLIGKEWFMSKIGEL